MKTILLIEDERHYSSNLSWAMEIEGYDCKIAPDGATGLQLAAEFPPDLVICDRMLPDIDGIEVVHRLRMLPPLSLTPIIVCSASAELVFEQSALAAGANVYLRKPISLDDLMATIRQFIDA